MPTKSKKSGAYSDLVGVFSKKSGLYQAVVGMFDKASAAYSSVLAPAIPAAPTIATAPAIISAIQGQPLTFTAASGISGYPTPSLVYDAIVSGSVVAAGITSGSYTLPTAGVSITVRATAANASGSTTSTSIPVTVAAAVATVPGQVTGLTIGAVTDTTQVLTFTAPSNGGAAISDYVIQWANAGSGVWNTFADGVGTGLSITVTGLIQSTPYDYRVAAVNGVGQGAYSAPATNTTAATVVFPAYLRQYLMSAGFAESGTGPYTYTKSSGASGGAGGTNLVFKAGSDGSFTGQLLSNGSGWCGIAVKAGVDGTVGLTGGLKYFIYCSGIGSAYGVSTNDGAGISLNVQATNSAAGDYITIERVGSTFNYYIARSATPNAKVLVHTVTGAVTSALFPCIVIQNTGSIAITGFTGLGQYIPWVSTAVSVTMDGNSIVHGTLATTDIETYLSTDAASPLFGTGITVVNSGSDGFTWANMAASLPAFVAGKINVCIAWETTNSLWMGATPTQAMADCVAYITALKAANPNWRVVLMTTLPRQNYGSVYTSVAQFNTAIADCNTYMRANYKAMGACALVDVCPPGGVFDLAGDYSTASFNATNTRAGGTVWYESLGSYTHLNALGNSIIAGLIEPALNAITLRD